MSETKTEKYIRLTRELDQLEYAQRQVQQEIQQREQQAQQQKQSR